MYAEDKADYYTTAQHVNADQDLHECMHIEPYTKTITAAWQLACVYTHKRHVAPTVSEWWEVHKQ